MKRKLIIYVLATVCLICFTEQLSSENIFKEFNLKLSGGYGAMSVGDLNDFYDSRINLFDNYMSFLREYGITASRTGEAPDLDKGMEIFAEFMAHLTQNFALSVGFGYMQRTAESEVTLLLQIPEDPGLSETTTWRSKPKITTYPILLSAYYFLPVLEKLNIFFNAGVGAYFGKQSLDETLAFSGYGYSDTQRETGSFKGTAFGFHGGIGAEFKVRSNIAIFIEGKARSATIKELKGEQTLQYGGSSHEHSGTIWYVEEEESMLETTIKRYEVDENKPDDSWLMNVRKWRVNLSGISGLIGIRFSFGSKK